MILNRDPDKRPSLFISDISAVWTKNPYWSTWGSCIKGDREIICDDGTGPGKQKRRRITRGTAAEWTGTDIQDIRGNLLTEADFTRPCAEDKCPSDGEFKLQGLDCSWF